MLSVLEYDIFIDLEFEILFFGTIIPGEIPFTKFSFLKIFTTSLASSITDVCVPLCLLFIYYKLYHIFSDRWMFDTNMILSYNINMKVTKYQREIIEIVCEGIISIPENVISTFFNILKPSSRNKKSRYKKAINSLIDNNVIYLSGEKIVLTKKGKTIFDQIQIEEISFPVDEKWDGVWHLICYDIPEKYKHQRDYFRNKLKQAGCKEIQKSLFVYPYNCKQEIAVISQNYHISPFVAYLNTDYLPMQNMLIHHFNIQ